MRSHFLNETTVKAIKENMHWRDWMPYQVAIETGLRIGDVLALRWCNIGEDGLILYQAKKTGKVGGTRVSEKTLKKLMYYAFPNCRGWLFPGKKPGRPLTRQTAWYRLKSACKRAGIDPDGISPHSFRKIFAVDAMQATKGNIEAVRKALQHDGLGDTALYAFSDKYSQ